MKQTKPYKKIPEFWWDFEGHGFKVEQVIVECDHPDFPLIAVYPMANEKDATLEIKMAEKLIKDLKSGRKDFKELAKLIPENIIAKVYGKNWKENRHED
jgi:hypothetical protein